MRRRTKRRLVVGAAVLAVAAGVSAVGLIKAQSGPTTRTPSCRAALPRLHKQLVRMDSQLKKLRRSDRTLTVRLGRLKAQLDEIDSRYPGTEVPPDVYQRYTALQAAYDRLYRAYSRLVDRSNDLVDKRNRTAARYNRTAACKDRA